MDPIYGSSNHVNFKTNTFYCSEEPQYRGFRILTQKTTNTCPVHGNSISKRRQKSGHKSIGEFSVQWCFVIAVVFCYCSGVLLLQSCSSAVAVPMRLLPISRTCAVPALYCIVSRCGNVTRAAAMYFCPPNPIFLQQGWWQQQQQW